MNLERTARDLCVLTDWYTERPQGLTFRELGERYGMSESGAHQVVFGKRGVAAKLLWPSVCARLIGTKESHVPMWKAGAAAVVYGILEEQSGWTGSLMAFADDRRELARCVERAQVRSIVEAAT